MGSKKEETYEGIDFDGIKESCGLENDEIKVLKICFNMFDFKDQGFLSGELNIELDKVHLKLITVIRNNQHLYYIILVQTISMITVNVIRSKK